MTLASVDAYAVIEDGAKAYFLSRDDAVAMSRRLGEHAEVVPCVLWRDAADRYYRSRMEMVLVTT